jgi:hypothetical protein
MHVVSAQLAGREERAEFFVRNLALHGVPSKFIQHAMAENGGTISGDRVADLDAVVYRLLLRDSSFARLFLRSSRGSARTSSVHSMFKMRIAGRTLLPGRTLAVFSEFG